ncbi:MAG: hypothetical protein M3416_02465 [Acidobacteriota bacterium]|nr:hypothetical protein [Acidobacteriota bacterium]
MIEKHLDRMLRPALLAAAWVLLAYSTLFGGFSVTLADIYGGNGSGLRCSDLTNCRGSASCNSSGTVNGCLLTCSNGSTIQCLSP